MGERIFIRTKMHGALNIATLPFAMTVDDHFHATRHEPDDLTWRSDR